MTVASGMSDEHEVARQVRAKLRRTWSGWQKQLIGVGIERCPRAHEEERQPQRPRSRLNYAAYGRGLRVVGLRKQGMTYGQIAALLGVSVERVRQIERGHRRRWMR